MVLADNQWQFLCEKCFEPAPAFFLIPVDRQIDTQCKSVDELYGIAERVECFSIRQVIYQVGKSFGYFIRVFCRLFVAFPAVYILFYELPFAHVLAEL